VFHFYITLQFLVFIVFHLSKLKTSIIFSQIFDEECNDYNQFNVLKSAYILEKYAHG